jgi:phage shock protein A
MCTIVVQLELEKLQQSFDTAIETQCHLLEQKDEQVTFMKKWYQGNKVLLKGTDRKWARNALTLYQTARTQVDKIQQQIHEKAFTIQELNKGIIILQKPILEINTKYEQLLIRARIARSILKVTDLLRHGESRNGTHDIGKSRKEGSRRYQGSSSSGTMTSHDIGFKTKIRLQEAFQRMEDQVLELETAAEIAKNETMTWLLDRPDSSIHSLSNTTNLDLENDLKGLDDTTAASVIEEKLAIALKKQK